MGMNVVDGRRRLVVQRFFFYVSHHAHDLAKWVLLFHCDADLLVQWVFIAQKPAHKCLIHNETMRRGLNVIGSGKVAAAFQRDLHRPEISRQYRADRGYKFFSGPGRWLPLYLHARSGCNAVKGQKADGAGGAYSRQLAESLRGLLEKLNLLLWLRVALLRQRDPEVQEVLRIQSRIHILQSHHAPK